MGGSISARDQPYTDVKAHPLHALQVDDLLGATAAWKTRSPLNFTTTDIVRLKSKSGCLRWTMSFPVGSSRRRGLKVLPGAQEVLSAHQPILFYESFNHRAEILDLLHSRDHLVFESDRSQAVTAGMTNFLALPALGYPIDFRHE